MLKVEAGLMNDERILGQGHRCRELLPSLRRHCPTSFLVMKLGEGM